MNISLKIEPDRNEKQYILDTKKTTMKYLILNIILQLGFFSTVFGQTVEIEVEKTEYKFDEIIEVKFVIDFNEDSITASQFDGFELIDGPYTSSSTSIINGVKQYQKSLIYFLRPINSGDLVINSPTFFQNENRITNTKDITVLDSELTKEEKQNVEFNAFVEESFKPEGTIRYVINDDFGYIEIFKDNKWSFHRRLSDEEIDKLKEIK